MTSIMQERLGRVAAERAVPESLNERNRIVAIIGGSSGHLRE
jgi:hypothetical protein